ncbi:hypothetical protein [Parvibaculum sp.]|uniref:hypothetical protein n=1 Tax=Parvibaculum sp. TaxID=2024848 RepID=UPI0034A0A541
MTRTGRRLRAAFGCALACGALLGPLAAPARAATFAGAPDAAIFTDHFALLQEHERAIDRAPAAAPARPPISSLAVRQRRASLPPLPDIHEVKGITARLLLEKSGCLACAPGPAAAATGLPVGVFETALRRAVEEGWLAGYREMRAAAPRAVPPGVKGAAAREAHSLRYIRSIVHGWQVAVVRTLRARNRITVREAERYLAVLDRTMPPPGRHPHAKQRIRTGWVSDAELDRLDRRHAPPVPQKRLADPDTRRIAETFVAPTGKKPQTSQSAVEGNSNVIPFARLATGYADDMLLDRARSFLPSETQIWSRAGGNWTLDGALQRVAVSGGVAWPLGEATRIGTAVTWGRGWRDNRKSWVGESLFISPFVSYAMSAHVRLRVYGGVGYRSDRVDAADDGLSYTGNSFFSGASVEGAWRFGNLRFSPSARIGASRVRLASPEASGEARSRGRATYSNGFSYKLPATRHFSKIEPFADFTTHWTFDRVEREAALAEIPVKSEIAGAIESGVLLKALDDFVGARLAAGVADIGARDETNYTVSGQLKLAF